MARLNAGVMQVEHGQQWLEHLWQTLWRRAHIPLLGVQLTDDETTDLVAGFLRFRIQDVQKMSQEAIDNLTHACEKNAKTWLAAHRDSSGDQDHDRDREKTFWVKNPTFSSLIKRSADGSLKSTEWSNAEPILWQRSQPICKKLSIRDDDARDVYMETLADFLKARKDTCPLREMDLFEELPRLFATVMERRAISWIRKQTALKNKPNHQSHSVSLDDDDSQMKNRLHANEKNDWHDMQFHEIKERCGDVLSDFEWHLLDVIYVSQTQTRNELVNNEDICRLLELENGASLSTRQRKLHTVLGEALARLGNIMKQQS